MFLGILCPSILIWLYRMKGLESVKDDASYELIFRQLSILLVTLMIMLPRLSYRYLMIIYLYWKDILR